MTHPEHPLRRSLSCAAADSPFLRRLRTSERRFWFLAALPCAVIVSVAGCSRPVPTTFVKSDEVKKLPSTHQKQIETGLARYFGQPLTPLLRLPADDEYETAAESADSSASEESGDGESSAPRLKDVVSPRRLVRGALVYEKNCAACHGASGDGNGPAAEYLNPRPRDYRQGVFKFTSTPYGARPRRQDLVRTIRRGAKGTSMPSFAFMDDDDLQAVVDYVIVLSRRGELERFLAAEAEDYAEDEPIDEASFAAYASQVDERWKQVEHSAVMPRTPAPPYNQETIELGRKTFLAKGCKSCHGEDGKGQRSWLSAAFIARQESLPEGQREKINYDAWGQVAPAADLTAGMLHGGRRPIDIYRRIYSGINGTPMPGFGQSLEASGEVELIWPMVYYVLSLVEGDKS